MKRPSTVKPEVEFAEFLARWASGAAAALRDPSTSSEDAEELGRKVMSAYRGVFEGERGKLEWVFFVVDRSAEMNEMQSADGRDEPTRKTVLLEASHRSLVIGLGLEDANALDAEALWLAICAWRNVDPGSGHPGKWHAIERAIKRTSFGTPEASIRRAFQRKKPR